MFTYITHNIELDGLQYLYWIVDFLFHTSNNKI